MAGLLCSWSLAGARVFGWLFLPIVSYLFLFYHGIVPHFHSPSISSRSFQNSVCFCVFFSISFGGISPPVIYAWGLFLVGGCLDWGVISPHMLELFFGSPFIDLFFFSFPFILIEDLCVISSIHDTLLISVASVSLGR